jgi:signal transduction histidine kinase
MAEFVARSLDRLAFAGGLPVVRSLQRVGRDLRVTLILCALLVGASLIACALLQMRQDQARAAQFEEARSRDLAAAAAATLDRYARMGRVFAQSPEQYRSAELGRAEPAIRDIAVWDGAGNPLARLNPTAVTSLPRPVFAGRRAVFAGGLAFREGGRTVEVLFDPSSLPAAAAAAKPASAPQGLGGAMPLYLLLVLAPAVAAAFLAVALVRAFEARDQAARAVRALKSTRPVEARLLVRLAHAERGAQEALRAKSEFIAHMSHELRTPLNAVIGFADIIARELYGPAGHSKYPEYASDIGHAGRALHARIGDILEFASIEAGHYPLVEEPVELAELVRTCIEDHQGRAFSRRISMSLAFGEPGRVRADRRALARILSNLLANALAYTAQGGIVRADVRFEAGAGVVTLSDSGAGFSEAERGRAGRPFTRFDRPGTVTGAGLGLAIAMELARRMGGAMRLIGQDGPHQGATMELRLPRL